MNPVGGESFKQPRYLIFFRSSRAEFWYEELDSVLKLNNLSSSEVYGLINTRKRDVNYPFLKADFPSEEIARTIASRCTLIRCVLDLWAHSKSYDELLKLTQEAAEKDVSRGKYLDPNNNEDWRLDVYGFGLKLSMEDQQERREKLLPLNFSGEINLSNKLGYLDVNRFLVIEHIKIDHLTPIKAKNLAKTPEMIYFGRVVAEGMQDVVQKYTLKRRVFLGPTSTESELSFLMANQCLATKEKIIYDPFVGTGSLLISCSHFGAKCFGSDIDIRILKGIKKVTDPFSNFEQYRLPKPDLWRMDFSPRGISLNSLEGEGVLSGLFDAIVCDPPYGIRAGARKSGVDLSRKPHRAKNASQQQANSDATIFKQRGEHIPHTQIYRPEDLLPDLIDSAAKLLVLGGRLVYLLPVDVGNYEDDLLPRHPCLKVIANSEDFISMNVSRRLITMEKVAEYQLKDAESYSQVVEASKRLLTKRNKLYGQDKQNIEKINGELILDKAERRRQRKRFVKQQKLQRRIQKRQQFEELACLQEFSKTLSNAETSNA